MKTATTLLVIAGNALRNAPTLVFVAVEVWPSGWAPEYINQLGLHKKVNKCK